MVCADPGPDDKGPPYADLVCFAPMDDTEAFKLSCELWPERAERMVAAHNALIGHEVDNIAQLVADGMAVQAFAKATPDSQGIEALREWYAQHLPTPKTEE